MGIITPTDFHIFRGVGQPPTSNCWVNCFWIPTDNGQLKNFRGSVGDVPGFSMTAGFPHVSRLWFKAHMTEIDRTSLAMLICKLPALKPKNGCFQVWKVIYHFLCVPCVIMRSVNILYILQPLGFSRVVYYLSDC